MKFKPNDFFRTDRFVYKVIRIIDNKYELLNIKDDYVFTIPFGVIDNDVFNKLTKLEKAIYEM